MALGSMPQDIFRTTEVNEHTPRHVVIDDSIGRI